MAKKAAAATTKAKAAATAAAFGVDEYTDFIFDHGHPEWVVVAAEAPAETLTDAFATAIRAKTRPRWANVPLRARTKSDDELFPPLVPIVSAGGTKWSSVLWITSWPIQGSDMEESAKVATKLSRQLRCRTLSFVGEDTSGCMNVTVFAGGKKAQSKDWYQDDPTAAYFTKLGYYLPPCFAMRKGKGMEAVAPAASLGRITRCDVLDVGGRLGGPDDY